MNTGKNESVTLVLAVTVTSFVTDSSYLTLFSPVFPQSVVLCERCLTEGNLVSFEFLLVS